MGLGPNESRHSTVGTQPILGWACSRRVARAWRRGQATRRHIRGREERHMSPRTPRLLVFTPRAWHVERGEPVRVAHAALADSRTTLCGLRVDSLVEFPDYRYADLRDAVRCDECDNAIALMQHAPDGRTGA